ncbi:hypothetical protein MASR2M78_31550 [Treponema sp.]
MQKKLRRQARRQAQASAQASAPIFYIRSIEYKVEGITKDFALKKAGEFKLGQQILGELALKKYLKEKTQILINERVLESVEIIESRGTQESDTRIPVDLLVRVRDTWNIIALPYFKYDSNDGLELSAKGRDYNFLGTMQPLKIDLGYTIESDDLGSGNFAKGAFFTEIDSNTAFVFFDRDWIFDFDHYIAFSSSDGFEYENKTGLSLAYPLGSTLLTIGAYQGVSVNEKNSTRYREEYGERYEDHWYLSNWLEASWDIPTGIRIDGFGDLQYIPRAEFRNNYRPGGDIGEERRGPTAMIGQSLEFGRINWVGNFRRGLEVVLDNENTFNFDTMDWNREISAETTAHLPINSFFGLSSRFEAVLYFDDYDDKAGSPLRGILDDSVRADRALYLNSDFPVRVIRFMPSLWFQKRSLRIFDFEQLWTPFIDAALLHDPEKVELNDQNVLLSGGLEVVTFPLFMRSLYIRISLGFNLREAWDSKSLPNGDGREFFFGLGHHY